MHYRTLSSTPPVLDRPGPPRDDHVRPEGIGDRHLTWENEAHLEFREAQWTWSWCPTVSIRAEPHVAGVDANVDRQGDAAAPRASLNYLYTRRPRRTLARHFYRPINPDILSGTRRVS